MDHTGHVGVEGYDQVIFRGNPARQAYIALWLLNTSQSLGVLLDTN